MNNFSIAGLALSLLYILAAFQRYFIFWWDPSEGLAHIVAGIGILLGFYIYHLLREERTARIRQEEVLEQVQIWIADVDKWIARVEKRVTKNTPKKKVKKNERSSKST